MLLFAGLGNPGPRYAGNRHNIGFLAVDEIHRRHRFAPWRRRFHGETAEGQISGARILLLKPMTFMNESGRAVDEGTGNGREASVRVTTDTRPPRSSSGCSRPWSVPAGRPSISDSRAPTASARRIESRSSTRARSRSSSTTSRASSTTSRTPTRRSSACSRPRRSAADSIQCRSSRRNRGSSSSKRSRCSRCAHYPRA